VQIIPWLNNTHTKVVLPGVDNCAGNKELIRVPASDTDRTEGKIILRTFVTRDIATLKTSVPVLAERRNFIAMSGFCHDMLSVCRLSSRRLITQFSHESSVKYLLLARSV